MFVGAIKSDPNNLEFAVAGASVYQNKTDVTSYSYDSVKREFVSYDTPSIAKMKALYAVNKGLAGTMFWEVCITFNCRVHRMTHPVRAQLSQDKVGSESLISSSAEILGSLDTTQNHVK